MAAPERRLRRGGAVLGLALLAVGCGLARYAPCPVVVAAPLPDDAFERCREVLVRDYGALAESDAVAFRLRSGWAPCQDPPGQRRAAVFRDAAGLAVVVELRWLALPWFGVPQWTAPRGDDAAERELAERLASVLRDH
ncbi:MAG: hypothetical protein IT455_21585 [Planctomycetes bacterium]|nr:hypothetical protein [Planctomycetota bacterium]